MDHTDIEKWLGNFYTDEEYNKLVKDTCGKLIGLLGVPNVEEGIGLHEFKAELLVNKFKDSLSFEMYQRAIIEFDKVEGLPDPADVEEDENEEDMIIVYELAEKVSEEFEMDTQKVHELIVKLYYNFNRERIREDNKRSFGVVVNEITEFIRNLK